MIRDYHAYATLATMAPREDIPGIGHWRQAVRILYPDLHWATDEIPQNASLDEICVELEAVAGIRAIKTRSMLLARMAEQVARYRSEDAAFELFSGCPRLLAWACLQRIPALPSGIDIHKQILKAWSEWTYGRGFDSATPWNLLSREFYQDPSGNPLGPYLSMILQEFLSSMRAFYGPNPTYETVRGPLVRVWSWIPNLARYDGDDEPDLSVILQRFPVNERAL